MIYNLSSTVKSDQHSIKQLQKQIRKDQANFELKFDRLHSEINSQPADEPIENDQAPSDESEDQAEEASYTESEPQLSQKKERSWTDGFGWAGSKIVDGAKVVGSKVASGAEAVENVVEEGALTAGSAIATGAHEAGTAIVSSTKVTGQAISSSAHSVYCSLGNCNSGKSDSNVTASKFDNEAQLQKLQAFSLNQSQQIQQLQTKLSQLIVEKNSSETLNLQQQELLQD